MSSPSSGFWGATQTLTSSRKLLEGSGRLMCELCTAPWGLEVTLHCCDPGLALVSCCCARSVQPWALPRGLCKVRVPSTVLWGYCEELRGGTELQLQGWLCRDLLLLLLSPLQSGSCPFLLQAQPLLGLIPSPHMPFPAQRWVCWSSVLQAELYRGRWEHAASPPSPTDITCVMGLM